MSIHDELKNLSETAEKEKGVKEKERRAKEEARKKKLEGEAKVWAQQQLNSWLEDFKSCASSGRKVSSITLVENVHSYRCMSDEEAKELAIYRNDACRKLLVNMNFTVSLMQEHFYAGYAEHSSDVGASLSSSPSSWTFYVEVSW